jgi:hypothetical protein
MGSKGRCPIHEEMSQTSWPSKSKETWTKYKPETLLSIRKLALTARNTLRNKSLENLKNLKNGRVPYLGLELDHACPSKAKSISGVGPFNVQK